MPEITFPIIGLRGVAGSGKDVVADFFVNKGFCKAAFSDPMKRFCQKVFDLNDDQLWGSSEKRNEEFKPDDGWWLRALDRFSRPANDLVGECFKKEGDHREASRVTAFLALHQWFSLMRQKSQDTDTISCRYLLQTLGTEWGRELKPDIWVSYLFAHVLPTIAGPVALAYDQKLGVIPYLANVTSGESLYRGLVIADVRFDNEAEAIQGFGGTVIEIHRPGTATDGNVGIQGHASETEQRRTAVLPDHTLEMPEGLEKVQTLLEQRWESLLHPLQWPRPDTVL